MQRWSRVVVAAALLAVGMSGCASTIRPRAAARVEAAGVWAELPPAPLSPRAHTVGVWTGTTMLIVGGDTFMCPPTASCIAPTDPPLADGAAFVVSTGEWRSIAPAPVGFASAATAVLGDDAYFLVDRVSRSAPPVFLRYSLSRNAWTRLASPDRAAAGYGLEATDAVIVAYARSDELGPTSDFGFHPSTGTWKALPADPLTPAFDREMKWSGRHLYLFDHALVPNPGSAQPSLTRAARLDVDTAKWERLADSEMLGSGPWLADGDLIVSPAIGSADGGEVNNWGRSYPYGGMFDTATSKWLPLPPAPSGAFSAGAVGARRALYLATGGALLDIQERTWIELPRLGPAGATDDRTVVSAGSDAFVFGGVRWHDGTRGELLSDVWIWRSGRS